MLQSQPGCASNAASVLQESGIAQYATDMQLFQPICPDGLVSEVDRGEAASLQQGSPMVRPTLTLHPEHEEAAASTHYRFHLRYSDGRPHCVLFYDLMGAPQGLPVESFDGALCATVFHAMREQLDIHLHGAATAVMLRNLKEFQAAWSRWMPGTYQPIEISVDTILDAPRPVPLRSIAAFSGGVDSLFTLLRHNSQPTVPPHRVDGALLVHGFDIFLRNTADLGELIDRTAEMRELVGVSLRVIRTNSKELGLQLWEDSCGAQLAACMHFCSAEFSEGLIGSSESYDAMVLPWGSNPVTDHLLSGGALKITHDGAAFARTDKIAFLSRFPEAVRALKVCWEGERQGRNCGVCEKCVRTQLNFLAVGVADPACFDGPFDLRRIASIVIRNDVQIAELRSLCDYAERQNIDAEWLRLLRVRLRKGKANRTLKGMAKACLAKIGLLDAARKLRSRLASEAARDGHAP